MSDFNDDPDTNDCPPPAIHNVKAHYTPKELISGIDRIGIVLSQSFHDIGHSPVVEGIVEVFKTLHDKLENGGHDENEEYSYLQVMQFLSDLRLIDQSITAFRQMRMELAYANNIPDSKIPTSSVEKPLVSDVADAMLRDLGFA